MSRSPSRGSVPPPQPLRPLSCLLAVASDPRVFSPKGHVFKNRESANSPPWHTHGVPGLLVQLSAALPSHTGTCGSRYDWYNHCHCPVAIVLIPPWTMQAHSPAITCIMWPHTAGKRYPCMHPFNLPHITYTCKRTYHAPSPQKSPHYSHLLRPTKIVTDAGFTFATHHIQHQQNFR